ncbi:hypothetical protein [Sphingomonas sp.]|uniref:hypothetical protein n=1 Tax=Sphingomonas sp. TaxID=28214 RepID=UPI001B11C529|nr:hypothetical protein [Sphingomonas sp.]MBO9711316.1 hypothetical protein [Sphingomonas sp.]
MPTFDELQSLFLEREFRAIGLATTTGQVLQPATPITGGDQGLWDWFNQIPDTSQIMAPTGSEFFSAYSDMINSLIPGRNPLDPVAVAKKNLAAWGSNPPGWSIGYDTMTGLLAAAPTVSFPVTTPAPPASDFWGLWTESPAIDGIAGQFAAAALSMSLSFGHLLNFAPTPSSWYLSTAMATAYNNPGKNPWNPSSPISWNSTFGADGTMPRFVANLIVADQIAVTYTSQAEFDSDDQATIQANADSGLWPYYLDSTTASTSVSFDGDGHMTVSITTPAGVPIALAGTVLSAPAYLGLS